MTLLRSPSMSSVRTQCTAKLWLVRHISIALSPRCANRSLRRKDPVRHVVGRVGITRSCGHKKTRPGDPKTVRPCQHDAPLRVLSLPCLLQDHKTRSTFVLDEQQYAFTLRFSERRFKLLAIMNRSIADLLDDVTRGQLASGGTVGVHG